VPVVLSAVLPYARPSGGLGRVLGSTGPARTIVAVLIAAAVCVLLHAALLLAIAGGLAALAGAGAMRRLGGVTGDVLGAAAELAETGALVAAVALL
jgi:adenosylcobinamide-GDP ribazoletransferase